MTTVEIANRPGPHAILDRLSLINARRHVAMIAADPGLISEAQTWLQNEARRMVVYRYWRFILGRCPLEPTLRLLVEDSARGQWLRSGNPFSLVTPVETEENRRTMYQKAKRDIEMARGPMAHEFAASERRTGMLLDAAINQAVSKTSGSPPENSAYRDGQPS